MILSTTLKPGELAQGVLDNWHLSLPYLMASACSEANRDLTAGEWSTDVGNVFPYEDTCPTDHQTRQ